MPVGIEFDNNSPDATLEFIRDVTGELIPATMLQRYKSDPCSFPCLGAIPAVLVPNCALILSTKKFKICIYLFLV